LNDLMSILLSYKITVTAYSAKRVFNQIYDRNIPLNPFRNQFFLTPLTVLVEKIFKNNCLSLI
jgi:hypothetical protein